MANKTMSTKGGLLANRQQNGAAVLEKKTISAAFNELIDKEGIKGRISELLGKRAPQFTASLVSLVNSDDKMQEVFQKNPVTIIQSALKAATYDLPTDPALGFAYVYPFGGKATFVMGYRGLLQLAMRTGVYRRINVTDVRETELVEYNRLTEDIELEFIKDENERAKAKIIGFVGYYRLCNGMEKTIYMSVGEIKQHEKNHRKGNYMNALWKDTPENAENFQAMCMKTVLRKLIGKWGIMSIDYQNAPPDVVAMASNIAQGTLDDEDANPVIEVPIEPIPNEEQTNIPPEDFEIPFDEN